MLASAILLDAPDDELLRRFIARCDEAAFHTLVIRHGGMVWSVCRSVLRNEADAEDAFQATFLLLATKAQSVRNPRALAGWLHAVAGRVARKARTARHRRRGHEARSERPAESGPADRVEDQRVIHEELSGLPEKYRLPLVLTYFDGRTQDAAANALGLSKSGIKKRLDRGRELLRSRLIRRGLSAVLLPIAVPAVSPTLAASTAALATAVAAGTVDLSAVPAGVLALIHGGVKSMTVVKLIGFGSLLAAAALGVGLMAQEKPNGSPPPGKGFLAIPPAAQAPAVAGWKERIVLEHNGRLVPSVAFRPDGTALAVGGTNGKVTSYDAASYQRQWEADIGGNFAAVGYSWDGKTLGATFQDGIRFLDAATGTPGDTVEQKGSLPNVVAFFPDRPVDDSNLTSHKVIFGTARGYYVKNWLEWPKVGTIETSTVPAGKEPIDKFAVPLAVDPDSRCAVITGPIDGATKKNVVWAYVCGDYGKGSPGNRLLVDHKAVVTSAAWSGDGKTIITGDAGGTVIVWDAKTMKETIRKELGHRIAAVAITTDGSRVSAAVIEASGNESYHESVYVWDPRDAPKDIKPLPVAGKAALGGPFEGFASLAFSPDGKTLAAAFCNLQHLSRLGILVGKVRVWEPSSAAAPGR
jgi:RNA polymerase sigma factor (sigma-70 family)